MFEVSSTKCVYITSGKMRWNMEISKKQMPGFITLLKLKESLYVSAHAMLRMNIPYSERLEMVGA